MRIKLKFIIFVILWVVTSINSVVVGFNWRSKISIVFLFSYYYCFLFFVIQDERRAKIEFTGCLVKYNLFYQVSKKKKITLFSRLWMRIHRFFFMFEYRLLMVYCKAPNRKTKVYELACTLNTGCLTVCVP